MLDKVRDLVIRGRLKEIKNAVSEALGNGFSPGRVLDSMISAMDEIGDRFQRREIFVPEMLLAAKTMQCGVTVIRPLLLSGGTAGRLGKCIIGTVAGDLHDVGKNLAAMMIEAAGFEIVDLGVDVPPGAFVEAVRANPDCRLVGVSALLTTTMTAMAETVRALRESGLCGQVKIMVGGTPITPEFAAAIGADAYTADAGAAAAMAKKLAG